MTRRIIFVVCLLALLLWLKPFSWVLPSRLLVNPLGFSRAVYSSKGDLLRLSLSSDEKFRLWTPLESISSSMIDATLAQEDKWYYYHPGVNPIAILRAININVFGNGRSGGSTITMQVARMRYGLRTRSISGKLMQCLFALGIEAVFSKKQILEAYLNLAPYGGNIEGVGAASLVYYSKRASALSNFESLTLAVIPQRPSNRIPSEGSHLASLLSARERLLARSGHEGQGVGSLDLSSVRDRRELPFLAPHFTQRLISENSQLIAIESELELDLQRIVESAVSSYAQKNHKLGIQNISVVLAELPNMEVRSYIGSADFWNRDILGQVDGIKSRRSPGSALKPFIYALALQRGIIHPGSVLADTPFARANYNPENFDKDFLGPISATDALIRSRNTPAVSLLNQIGADSFRDFLLSAGIKGLKESSFYGLSLALGGVEVRPDELLAMYGMLANGGVLKPLRFVKNKNDSGSQERLLSPEASYLVMKMLGENPKPLSMFDSESTMHNVAVAWKTGTSFGFRDAWAVGIFGQYVMVVWIGNFDSSPNPAFVGRDSAGPLFFTLIDAISKVRRFSEPLVNKELNVKKVQVCAVSGELPGPSCSKKKMSWFIPGVSPIKSCTIHRKITVDPHSGLRTCAASPALGEEKIFEFWPSHILDTLSKGGIGRVRPPTWSPECSGDRIDGFAPLIISPDPSLSYSLVTPDASIPLSASSDGESRRIFWFADDQLVGVQEGSPIFWKPAPGRYVVRAVDEQGRAQSVLINVAAEHSLGG